MELLYGGISFSLFFMQLWVLPSVYIHVTNMFRLPIQSSLRVMPFEMTETSYKQQLKDHFKYKLHEHFLQQTSRGCNLYCRKIDLCEGKTCWGLKLNIRRMMLLMVPLDGLKQIL